MKFISIYFFTDVSVFMQQHELLLPLGLSNIDGVHHLPWFELLGRMGFCS